MKQPNIKQRLEVRQEPQDKIIVMHQEWRDLLFLHWEYDSDEIQKTIPPGLHVDTFEGRAYLGIIPFSLQNLRFSILPPIPGISNFSEVNVRTYVYDDHGTPGVWFYSLDANNRAAVEAANLIRLPYRHAQIKNKKDTESGVINYSVKRSGQETDLQSTFVYKSKGGNWFADSETLEFFLLERYVLFTYWKESRKLKKIQVHHSPYPLTESVLTAWDPNLLLLDNFHAEGKTPDHHIYSAGVDVKIYQPEEVKDFRG